MTIPTISEITKPLLVYAEEQIEVGVIFAETYLAKQFNLTKAEIKLEKKSGKERLFLHRIRWARTYLKKAKLIEDTRKGYFIITKLGLEIIKEDPEKITESYLNRFKSFKETRRNPKVESKN